MDKKGLFTVYVTLEGHDWNYLVRARNRTEAKAAVLKNIELEVVTKKAESWLLDETDAENIPKKDGDVYLFDEGT